MGPARYHPKATGQLIFISLQRDRCTNIPSCRLYGKTSTGGADVVGGLFCLGADVVVGIVRRRPGMPAIHRALATIRKRLYVSLAVAVVVSAPLAGCATPLPPIDESELAAPPRLVQPAAAGLRIGVLDAGWHTGLVFSARDLGAHLLGLRRSFPEADYLVIGWGEQGFYMAANPGVGTALRALFPAPSVLFVQGLAEPPTYVEVRWLCLSPVQGGRLDAYLARYLRTRANGEPIDLGPGLAADSRFFASTGTYDAFHTCNTWTAAALEYAGLPVTAQGVLFAGQVMSAVRPLPACH
jgi:uncharacterized protein (TIGR02117 family)